MQLTHSLLDLHGLQKLPSSIKDIVNNSPFLAADGTLFVGSKDSQIFTLELETGNLASVHSTKGLSTQLVPVDPDDDEQNANQVILPCARPSLSLSLCVCVCVCVCCASPDPITRHLHAAVHYANRLHGARDQPQERRGTMERHRQRVHVRFT
jgi:hypothetical protein